MRPIIINGQTVLIPEKGDRIEPHYVEGLARIANQVATLQEDIAAHPTVESLWKQLQAARRLCGREDVG